MAKTVLIVFGTRPEAIKLAQLVKKLQQMPSVNLVVCVTGQHRQMLDQVLTLFDIQPDIDLNIMTNDQSLPIMTAQLLPILTEVLQQVSPDLVLIHGDTTTAFVTALASYYQQIPIAHIEAGLRTGNLSSPYPEEANRRMIAALAHYHFAPTLLAKQNLIRENIDENTIWVTGNTVIDTLMATVQKMSYNTPLARQLRKDFSFLNMDQKMLLVTGHRRENLGVGVAQICQALVSLVKQFPCLQIVYPVHLNPQVREPVLQALSNIRNIYLLEPQSYPAFIYLMKKATIILTDSGGIQEEASALAKPILLMRETTERAEILKEGGMELVGTDSDKIITAVARYLKGEVAQQATLTLYGDGRASERIVSILTKLLDVSN